MNGKHGSAAFVAAMVFAVAGSSAMAQDEMGGGSPPPVSTPAPAPAAAPAPAPAAGGTEDVLVLKDGTQVRGRITAEDENGYAVKVGGSQRLVEKSTVAEVKRGTPGPLPGADDAMGGEKKPGKDGAAKEKKKDRRREGDAMNETPLSEDARKWALTCIENLKGTDPAIQRSAAEALHALGKPVLPVLREAHAAADDAARQRLERVASLIDGPEGKQGPKPGAAGAGRPGAGIMDRVKTDLALDDAQSRTVGAALMSLGRETRDILEDARDGLISYEDARTKVTGLRGKLRDDLKATLTEEQLVKLDGILDEMGKRMGGGGKKDGPKPDGAKPDAPKSDGPKPDAPKKPD